MKTVNYGTDIFAILLYKTVSNKLCFKLNGSALAMVGAVVTSRHVVLPADASRLGQC